MFFGKKCFVCGEHGKFKEEAITLGGTVRWWYCSKHWKIKEEQDKKKAEENRLLYELHIKEQERKTKYAKLEREVHYKELELKAKELGINFDGQV